MLKDFGYIVEDDCDERRICVLRNAVEYMGFVMVGRELVALGSVIACEDLVELMRPYELYKCPNGHYYCEELCAYF